MKRLLWAAALMLVMLFAFLVGKGGFLASLSSMAGGFMGREEPIAEIDLAKRGAPQFHPCEYGEGGMSAKSPVILNEIAWMGTAENYNAEWMELRNVSDADADISLWRIFESGERISIVIPKETSIPAGGFYLLARDVSGQDIAGNLSYEGALVNTGAGLRLYDASCALMDEVPAGRWLAGDNESKRTMERTAMLAWRTSSIAGGTPGGENSSGGGGIAPLGVSVVSGPILKDDPVPLREETRPAVAVVISPLFVSEVYVGDENSSLNEYLELFNPSEVPVLLTGWSLKKKSSTGAISSLISASRLEGRSIPAKGFFLVANEGGNFASVSDAVWARSNTLAYSHNAVLLMDPKGEIIQEVLWDEIPKGRAFSRRNDGGYAISVKTPGMANE